MGCMTLLHTDPRGRVTLPGHGSQDLIMQDNPDGSILLLPAVVVSEAQYAYDTNPELQQLLRDAAASPTVRAILSRKQ